VLSAVCYFIGWRALKASFVVYSFFSTAGYSLCYAVLENTPPIYPEIASHPLTAAIIGAVFVGVGSGISVRAGGAQSGDDALAMGLNAIFGFRFSAVYLCSDLAVLALSLTYLPTAKILWSLLTVVISGQLLQLTAEGFRIRKKPRA